MSFLKLHISRKTARSWSYHRLTYRVARRREDLEDLLADPQYFQVVFHTLPQVKLLYQGQADLGSANESIARTFPAIVHPRTHPTLSESNVALQEGLYRLRSETQESFDKAKQLEARWREVEKEQREVYQVRPPHFAYARFHVPESFVCHVIYLFLLF